MTAPANLPAMSAEHTYLYGLRYAMRAADDALWNLREVVGWMNTDSNALEARICAAGDDANTDDDVRLHIALCDDVRVLFDAIDALRRVMANVEGVQLAAEDREKMAAMVAAMEGKR